MPTLIQIDIDRPFKDIVCDIYQLVNNYVDIDNSDIIKSISPEYEKFNIWIKKNAPYCSNPKNFTSQITEDEFFKLKEKYNGEQISFIISQIENRKDLRKRYTNLYRTVLNWAKKSYG